MELKHNKSGEVVAGEFYDSSVQPLQKGVFAHQKGNAVMSRYNNENATILLKEGDFIQHTPEGYYKVIPQPELVDYSPVEAPAEADQPSIEPEPEQQS